MATEGSTNYGGSSRVDSEQTAPTRNLVAPETAERNAEIGGLTFNCMPPDDYDGPMMVFAAVRLGDHAHVEVQSGRWLGTGPSHRGRETGTALVGLAGRMVLRWHEWVAFRDLMDATTPYRIAEVQRPTREQLDRYVTAAPPTPARRFSHDQRGSGHKRRDPDRLRGVR